MNTNFKYQSVQFGTMDITASAISLNVEIRIQVSICMLSIWLWLRSHSRESEEQRVWLGRATLKLLPVLHLAP